MKNIVVIDGKEYDVILKPVEKTKDIKERRTGYEKAKDGDEYWYTDHKCRFDIEHYNDLYSVDEDVYLCGNAVTDPKLAEDRSRRNRLLWQLERFSAMGRKRPLVWGDLDKPNYYIWYDYSTEELLIDDTCDERRTFEVYFDSKELAEAAIKEFHDELIWFFTEYQDTAEFR